MILGCLISVLQWWFQVHKSVSLYCKEVSVTITTVQCSFLLFQAVQLLGCFAFDFGLKTKIFISSTLVTYYIVTTSDHNVVTVNQNDIKMIKGKTRCHL